ncbi:Zinc finger protein 32 [Nymphon striatum]|nr:Zinc finger protein 32 [Nymphon striatum]
MTSHSKMELVDWRRKSIKKEPEFDIEQNAATADFALGWLPLEIQTVKEENEDSPSSVFEQQCAGSTKENDNNELYEDLNEDQCCKNIVDPTFSKKFDTNIDDVYNNSHRTQWSLKTLKSDNKERKAYECNFCHERFIQEYNFKLHMQTHTKDKPFECNVCNKYFPYIGKLIDHMRTHTNVKPYECNVCHKTFATSRQLASHVQIHTNEKPYECDICHKLFTEIGNLEVHMCMHANEKPFKCNICHKYFATSSQFGIHVQEHTKEKPFTCDICHNRCHNNANILNLLNTFYAFWEIFVILHGAVHIMDFTLQRLLLEGKIQGRRGRGRPRTAWYHNIKEWMRMRYADCSRKAQNREEWRSITANLLKADGTEDR